MFRRIGIGCVGCLGIIVIAVIVLVVVGVFGSNSSSKTAKPKTGHVGTSIRIPDNLDVTLLAVKTKGKTPYDSLKPGNIWIVTSWRFHNYRGDTTDVAPTGFKAQAAGVVRQPEYFSTVDSNLLDVAGTQLAPKGSITGDILFEVRKNSPVKIVYAPDVLDSSKKGTWTTHS